jgi:hypothetical protein
MRTPALARRDARSHAHMQARARAQSVVWPPTRPTLGSRTAWTHSLLLFEPHHAPTASMSGRNTRPAARQPKHRGRQHPQPQTRGALEAHGGGASGPSTAARAPPIDSIAAMISAASRTPTGNSWWFSAQHRLLRVDLERSAPRRWTSSVIMMVMSAPARPDHLALIGSACTPPAGHCTAAAQRGEQKRSIVQWRSALSTAL